MDNNLSYRLTLKDFFRKTMLGATEDTKKLDSGMNKLEGSINRAGKAIGAYFALSSVKDFVAGVVQSSASMQSFNNAIIASSRSEAEGRTNLAFLNSEIDRLGLNLNAARDGYKTFNGAVMGTSIQGLAANKVFTQVAEATTVMGLSADQQQGAFLALGQMISKGTVQAEELRGQLGERIPGAFQIGARAMGMSTQELGDKMQKGLIKAEDFVVKFGNELQKTFGQKLEAATLSTTANINRMGNAWERLMANIGNSNAGVINSTVSFFGKMTEALSKYFEDANIMTANFAANGAKDFNMWQKSLHETIGVASGYGMGLGSIVYQEQFQKEAYALTQPKDLQEGYRNKVSLYKMSLEKDKWLKEGGIDNVTADRYQATFKGALALVNASIASFKNATKSEKDKTTDPTKNTSIGSPTEVNGPRPQNVTINVNKLGVVENMTVDSMTDGAKMVKEEWSKELLEVLNDANLIARR